VPSSRATAELRKVPAWQKTFISSASELMHESSSARMPLSVAGKDRRAVVWTFSSRDLQLTRAQMLR
jgi:hypothetical protein